MNVELVCQPGNTAAKITLAKGQICTAEAGAMIAMSGSMGVTTTTHKKDSGSLLKAAKRMIGGESLFLNHFEPLADMGELWLGTDLMGDMKVMSLNNESLIVQSGSFVACDHDVEVDLGWQGFKSLLSGEGVLWLNLKGTGEVIVSSFGAIYPVKVDGEQIVDSGHVVAFEESLDFTITKAGKSWFGSIFGGEGLVCKFSGYGTVWCQSHNPHGFGKSLSPRLRPRKG